jgi:hypothetical protein
MPGKRSTTSFRLFEAAAYRVEQVMCAVGIGVFALVTRPYLSSPIVANRDSRYAPLRVMVDKISLFAVVSTKPQVRMAGLKAERRRKRYP